MMLTLYAWWRGDLILVERTLLENIEGEMTEIAEPCDHDANTCWCSWHGILDALRELIHD